MSPIVSATILRTQSDERLLALTREGHERAFEAIVERYRRSMLRYCRRYLPESRAEDAVQQAFISAWSALRDGTEVGDLRPWLYRITRNAALDAVKRAGYDYHELSDALRLTPAPETVLERRAVMRQTLAGVAVLPANQRQALLRTVVEGHSRADIARDMHLSEGAVRQLVHRARTALRSAATALTPAPLLGWASSFGGPDGPIGGRIAELAAGGGAAGGAGVVAKTGTAIVVAGVLAVEAGTHLEHPSAAVGESQPAHQIKAAHAALASGSGPAGGVSRLRRPVATSSTAPVPRRRAAASSSGESSRHGSESSNRGPRELTLRSGTLGDSGTDDAQDGSSGPGGGQGDSQEDNSGPGSQTSGDGRDVDNSGSGSEGSDGDGDRSGSDSGSPDSENRDSDGHSADSGDDASGSGSGGGGSSGSGG
jgi:RNA polymerase sigma factor (sigma-70 family)